MAKTQYAHINAHGEIVLPHHLAKELGISPGDEIRIEPNVHGMYVHPPVNTLKRVYVELTNRCILNCSTCMCNVWDVEYGHMSMDLFEQILDSLDKASEKSELFFGGYGEPLSHPRVLSMIERAKDRGYRVSLITNGILLTEPIAQRMIDLNLDMLWVSLDGASAECYTDVRLGDSLPLILENLTCLRGLKYQKFGISVWSGYPKLGIAFVAMERNIHDLSEVIRLGSRLGAVEFSVSNVLAHNADLLEENLYMRSLDLVSGQEIRPIVHMPLMDIQPKTLQALGDVMKDLNQLELTGSALNRNIDVCPFS